MHVCKNTVFYGQISYCNDKIHIGYNEGSESSSCTYDIHITQYSTRYGSVGKSWDIGGGVSLKGPTVKDLLCIKSNFCIAEVD